MWCKRAWSTRCRERRPIFRSAGGLCYWLSIRKIGDSGHSDFRVALRVSGPKERYSLAGQNGFVACAFGQVDYSSTYAIPDLRLERAGIECAFDA